MEIFNSYPDNFFSNKKSFSDLDKNAGEEDFILFNKERHNLFNYLIKKCIIRIYCLLHNSNFVETVKK